MPGQILVDFGYELVLCRTVIMVAQGGQGGGRRYDNDVAIFLGCQVGQGACRFHREPIFLLLV